METSVTKKGQTNIPAAIRKRHQIREGDRLVWVDDGEVIRIVPAPQDPLKALRGAGQGEGLLDRLLQSRREDRGTRSSSSFLARSSGNSTSQRC